MVHKHGVLHINLYVVIITGKMRVHVNQTEKIETQGGVKRHKNIPIKSNE